jgi:predicted DNA-binding transcriptional regulator YafY
MKDMKRPSIQANRIAGRQLMTRPPMDRMHQIFQAIKGGHHPNRVTLATDIEVTTKTIQRDVDFMRDRLNLPIAYNDKHRGYEFTQPVESFPLVELCEAELISVFVAQRALMQYRGTPFEAPLRSAFEKLVAGLEGKITLAWEDIEDLISFRNFEIVPTDLKTFQAVSEAVLKSSAIEFEYKKLNASSFQKRTVKPYHLACVQNQWYCFGHDVDRSEMRTFVMARMRGVALTGQTFKKTAKFSLEAHLRDSLGVFSAKGKYNIRIRFDKFAAQLVRERIWHAGQSIQELVNGEVELRITLSSLHEIESWLLSWGEHARVLVPKELVGRMRKRFQAALSLLEEPSSPR